MSTRHCPGEEHVCEWVMAGEHGLCGGGVGNHCCSLFTQCCCLTTFSLLLALLQFSSADKWNLTWFQRAGSVFMDYVREKSFSSVLALLWKYVLLTTSWSFIPHAHPHRSCCNLDIHYLKLEVLGRRVVSLSSPEKNKGCLISAVANPWHLGQNWHELLL